MALLQVARALSEYEAVTVHPDVADFVDAFSTTDDPAARALLAAGLCVGGNATFKTGDGRTANTADGAEGSAGEAGEGAPPPRGGGCVVGVQDDRSLSPGAVLTALGLIWWRRAVRAHARS
jgi:hypothetical protein